ncbi:hypothetical protein BDW22DRAFT_76584 [Trametopsis cervina]|nr:hypothetical protein BDW22DRAFT_76584 [Trametopsis cervina]
MNSPSARLQAQLYLPHLRQRKQNAICVALALYSVGQPILQLPPLEHCATRQLDPQEAVDVLTSFPPSQDHRDYLRVH